MTIDLCSESSGFGMSPRISFSHDLCQTDGEQVENCCPRSDSSLLESSSDFDFSFSQSFEQESSSADELFSDGKILPVINRGQHLPRKKMTQQSNLPFPACSNTVNSNRERLKETPAATSELEEKPQSKSFWRFSRSASLNCGDGYKRGLICSLPLLLRSKSTGSAQNQKRPLLSKENHKKQSQKQQSSAPPKSSSSSSTTYSHTSSRKPPLKKNFGGSYGNGTRSNPVLNVPPPYIAKGTANLLGIGSLLWNGKDKNKRK